MKAHARLYFSRLGPTALRIALILIVGGGAIVAFSVTPNEARAQTEFENDTGGDKAYWQERYRRLRDEAARLRKKADVARTAYAAANRRNYRRGTNRRVQRETAIEAETELVRIKAELAGLAEEARVSGAPPGWLREVEDEPAVDLESLPASAKDEDDGRNPLYSDE